MRSIEWTNRARKQLKRIPKQFQEAIGETVAKLAGFPECKDLNIVILKNHRYDYRLRVGRYRVLFNDNDVIEIVSIQEVRKRDEHTY